MRNIFFSPLGCLKCLKINLLFLSILRDDLTLPLHKLNICFYLSTFCASKKVLDSSHLFFFSIMTLKHVLVFQLCN